MTERQSLEQLVAERFASNHNDSLAILGDAALHYNSTSEHNARAVGAALDAIHWDEAARGTTAQPVSA